ncbi:MAG: NAD-dependent epimerase/dehydratase family protein [Oleiphilaceae bacterium]|nr:NAD-dependent epimerase/dehydratase family protein [Oleiphilaceae bacterium]
MQNHLLQGPQTVAIIGATGMIGHHTAVALSAMGHRVIAVHRTGSDVTRLAHLACEAREADLAQADTLLTALEGVDAVINCAAYYPTVPRPWREEVRLATDQMAGFYQAVKTLKINKALYLGGAIALRKHPMGLPGHETLSYAQRPPGKNAYVQVKWAMDQQALEQARLGLPVVIGIPSMTFGEYDYGPTTGALVTEIASQRLPAYVRGQRNVIYAGDAGRGLALALLKGRPGERYLLTGENLTMDALVDKIATIAQVAPPRAVPLSVAKVVAKLQALRYRRFNGPIPKISETAIAVMSGGQFLDGSKARRELGYTPQVKIDEALQRAFDWFVAQGMTQK